MEKIGIPALVIELAFISNPFDLAAAEREAGERMIDMARTLLQIFPPGP
jgi:N-acetylmuramoyl-L-alanine amidase